MAFIRDAVQVFTKAPEPQRIPMSAAATFSLGGLGNQSDKSTQMNVYGSVGWLFAVVDRITTSVASADWHLFAKNRRNEMEIIENHPLIDLWQQPNPFYSRQEFLEISQQHLDLTGEMWWLVLRNSTGLPQELWPIRPDRITPVPDTQEFIKGYIYQIGNQKFALAREEVIFTRIPSPVDPYRGMGPIQSLYADLDSERLAATWVRNFFNNSAVPGGVIEFDQPLTDPEFEAFQMRWQGLHQGVSNAHRVALIERGHWKQAMYNQRDMQFEQLRRLNRDTILGAFGMPAAIMGISDSVNRANAEAAEVMYSRWVVRPRLRRIRSTVNRSLAAMFGEGLHLEFIDPTPEDHALALDKAERSYRAGFVTANEARAMIGLDEMAGGEDLRPANAPAGALTYSGNRKAPTGDETKVYESIGPLAKTLQDEEEIMQANWTKRLNKEGNKLAEYIGQFKSIEKLEPVDLEGYNWNWWEIYSEEVIRELAAIFSLSAITSEPLVGPTAAQIAAQQYALHRGGELLALTGEVSVTNATRERVGEIVARAIEDGETIGSIQAELIADHAFSARRAATIARTETATALGQGEKDAALRVGRNEKHWVTQGDLHVEEPVCLSNESQGWIKATQPFQSGHDTIPGHPNCRCVVRYRTADVGTAGVALIPEVRCPQCNKLIATKHAFGTHEYCPRCKEDFSAT